MTVKPVLSLVPTSYQAEGEKNRNLEEIARQLYDYWFVQFDFPDEEGKPYKSSGGKMLWNEKLKRNIPDGWSVENLFEATNVQYGFPFSTDLFLEEETDIPVVRIRDVLAGTVSAYTTETVEPKYQLKKGDLIIGMDGNFHINLWCDNSSYLNQRCVRIRAIDDNPIAIMQVRYEVAPYIKAKEKNAKGSTVGHLSDNDLKELWIMKPKTNCFFQPNRMFNNLTELHI